MNSEAKLLSLLTMFDSNKTLELVFIPLSLRVKVLGFHKEEKSKEEEDNRVNKVVLVIAIE